jgi:hypothetical protein
MGLFADLFGTSKSTFQVEIGGVKLENSAGALVVKDGASAVSDITVKKLFVQGDVIEINSDAAESSADRKYTIQRPAAGMSGAVTLTLPPNDGSPGQVMTTDGSGVLTFETPSSATPLLTCDTTTLNWNSAAEVSMFNLPVGAIVDRVKVVIDTSFDGTTPATMSVGTTGAGAAKYMASTQVNLKGTAKDVYESNPGELPVSASPEALVITFAAATGGSPSAGIARAMVFYVIPS